MEVKYNQVIIKILLVLLFQLKKIGSIKIS